MGVKKGSLCDRGKPVVFDFSRR